ncbi:nitrile hydratase accessory protein [Dactylosporangium sp. CS-033363]|uniref:nitrile hydratase accessory protein n=1 Tax=Dactylosporangium sp. CS-033363 TaxID=3239935 RepID=UPI003D8CE8F7
MTDPPRSNGELVFAEPWESRAFGLALTLHRAGAFAWDDFRARLAARLAREPAERYSYYRCWLDALEQTAIAQNLLARGAVDARAAALATRPAGHDHRH